MLKFVWRLKLEYNFGFKLKELNFVRVLTLVERKMVKLVGYSFEKDENEYSVNRV